AFDGVIEIVAVDLVLAAPDREAGQGAVRLDGSAAIVDARAVHELEQGRSSGARVERRGGLWRAGEQGRAHQGHTGQRRRTPNRTATGASRGRQDNSSKRI